MERLSGVSELLDGPLDDRPTLVGNLRDLRRANRWLGGARLSIKAVEAIAAQPGGDSAGDDPPGDDPAARPLTILDVGTGGADIPLALLDHAARAGRRWTVIGLDSRPEVLEAAATADRRVTAARGLELHVGDGRSLPYPDGSIDVVHTSLMLHHLEPAEARTLFVEMVRVARRGVVVNDLVRGRLALFGAWSLAHLTTRNRFTRNDAPLSVRRAYTGAELEAMTEAAGLRIVARHRAIARHRVVLAAVPTVLAAAVSPARPDRT